MPGWETNAIHPADRGRFRERVARFVEANAADLAEVARVIEADRDRPAYVRDLDSAWYQAGYLYVHTVQGSGVGLWEHGPAGERLAEAAKAERRGISALACPAEDCRAQHVTLQGI